MMDARSQQALTVVCIALMLTLLVSACSSDSAERAASAPRAQVIVPAGFETADSSNEDQGIYVDPNSDVLFEHALGEVISDVVINDECWSDAGFNLLCASSNPRPTDLNLGTISRSGDTFTAHTTANSTYLPAHLLLTVTSATKSDPSKTRSRTVLLTLTCC